LETFAGHPCDIGAAQIMLLGERRQPRPLLARLRMLLAGGAQVGFDRLQSRFGRSERIRSGATRGFRLVDVGRQRFLLPADRRGPLGELRLFLLDRRLTRGDRGGTGAEIGRASCRERV